MSVLSACLLHSASRMNLSYPLTFHVLFPLSGTPPHPMPNSRPHLANSYPTLQLSLPPPGSLP